MACCRIGGTECSVHAQDLLKEVAVIFITSTIVWPQVKQQRGNTALPFNRKLNKRFTEHGPAHQNKTQYPPQSVYPIRKLSEAPYPSPSEGRQTENHSHRKLPCLTQCHCEPCCAGPPKMDGSQWKILTKRGPSEEGMANHSSTLATRTS